MKRLILALMASCALSTAADAQVRTKPRGPMFNINDAVANESAGTISFTIIKTGSTSSSSSLRIATVNGSAVGGTDFIPLNGTVIFAPNETVKQVQIPLLDDTVAESTETFRVRITALSNARIGDGSGLGTITDVDVPTTPPPPPPPPPTSPTWTVCATEGNTCYLAAPANVRYGAGSTFTAPRLVQQAIECNNTVFGDPLFGTVKRCETDGTVGTATPPPPAPPPPSERTLFIEGDSISVCNTTNGDGSLCNLNFTYAGQYSANNSFAPEFGFATGGQGLNDLEANKNALISAKPATGVTVVSVLIGANDLAGQDGTTYYNNLVAYTDSLRAAGFRVVIGTILPSTTPGHNTERKKVNDLIRANAASKFSAVADFAGDALVGCDGCETNITYFSDGVHPTGEGHGRMVPIYKAAVEAAFTGTPPVTIEGLPPIASNFTVANALTPSWATGPGNTVGAFRFNCLAGQLAYTDPIVNPGPRGTPSQHLHQFFGNTQVYSDSDYASLRAAGGSTCNIVDDAFANNAIAANRSAYWIPAMLDGVGNVVRPDYVSIYYKRRPASDPKCTMGNFQAQGNCVSLPNGLRFIFGRDMTNLSAPPTGGFYFNCDGPTARPGQYATMAQAIANCPTTPTNGVYNKLGVIGVAPQCWDGKRLDSANHRDHVSYVYNTGLGYFQCPVTHPYSIPEFQIGAWYTVDANLGTWKLSSDQMTGEPAGSTYHADFFEAWDPTVKKTWHDFCINSLLDCTGGALGNDKMLKGATGAPFLASPRLVPVPAYP
mgnify:CR=1 FL=1